MKISENYYRFINVPTGDLRISITDNCNMGCVYCHNEGQKKGGNFMPLNTLNYIVDNALRYGVHKVRLTGGEPLLHPQINEICKVLKSKSNITMLGINTNAYDREKLFEVADYVDQIVVGIDFFNGECSKQSPIGPTSNQVLTTVLELKKKEHLKVEIDSVLSDPQNMLDLMKWCLNNNVLIKVLEQTGKNCVTSNFEKFISTCADEFGFQIGKDIHFNEYFLFDETGMNKKVMFYHSHCNHRDCDPCRKMHLRVMTNGKVKPCLLREDTEISLVNGDFEQALSKAIANLGVGPEKEPY